MSEKPRMVEIASDERKALLAVAGELGTPALYQRMDSLSWWADADELRAWRASQNAKGAERG